MFHVVFDPRGAELISAAMDLDESLDGETILISDDYSVGPIQNLFSESGLQERSKWWDNILGNAKTSPDHKISGGTDAAILGKTILRMEEEEFDQIWIWVAPNIRDVCGYYWLMSQLKVFSGRIFLLSLNNLPFIGEKGNVFYPHTLSEIPAREFVKAKKLGRLVTSSEFETDPDEWMRLASENKNLRLLEGGKKVIQREDDYYDNAILHNLQPVFQKITRVIQQYLLKSTEKLNESFLLWRLKLLVVSGVAEQQGETIRLAVTVTVNQVDN
jgi:Domain of unknown function (DUF1835)/Protein of unknown function